MTNIFNTQTLCLKPATTSRMVPEHCKGAKSRKASTIFIKIPTFKGLQPVLLIKNATCEGSTKLQVISEIEKCFRPYDRKIILTHDKNSVCFSPAFACRRRVYSCKVSISKGSFHKLNGASTL